MKKIVVLAALILGLISCSVMVSAAEIQSDNAAESPQEVVAEYVDAVNCKDWDKFTELQVEKEREGYKNFFSNPENINNNRGILNIKSIKTIESKEVGYEHVKDELELEQEYNNLKVFVLGMDLEVVSDTRYYCNGINYNYIVMQNQNNQWKILKTVAVYNPQKLLDMDYNFSESLNETVAIMDKREEGIFLNSDGVEFAKFDGGQLSSVNKSEFNTFESFNAKSAVVGVSAATWYPSEGQPVIVGNRDGQILAIPAWRNYILGCMAGEVRGSQFNGKPRRAIALAIKTFTWNFLIHPRSISKGIDIWITDQNYAPEYIDSNIIYDYEWVKNNWMVNSNGDVFEASYGRGDRDDSFHGKSPAALYHGGLATQYGCEYLVRVQNYSFFDCMRYFYDYSPKSGGPIIFKYYKSW